MNRVIFKRKINGRERYKFWGWEKEDHFVGTIPGSSFSGKL
jgi:hypothetical protein